ncbi:MAG: RNA polymerase sigma factor, partial [Pseudomonadales bacterium]
IKRTKRRPLVAMDPNDMPEPVTSVDMDDALVLEQRKHRLQAAIGELPARDRTVLALAYSRELTTSECAQILGCTSGAFRTRLSRARTRLAKILETSHDQYGRCNFS